MTRKIVAVISLIVSLAFINYSIWKKEDHIRNGTVAYFELAPVDPRSLIQGDFMALQFRIANDIRSALKNEINYNRAFDGKAIIQLDENNVAQWVSSNESHYLEENQITVAFRVRKNRVKFATDAFFFQEGHAQSYDVAKFGQFRINKKGEPLLTGLYDENLKRITP